MMRSSNDELPIAQFSLQGLFLVVSLAAVACWLLFQLQWKLPLTWTGYIIYMAITATVATALGYFAGQFCAKVAHPVFDRHVVRSAIWILLPMTIALCAYNSWALYRWLDANSQINDPGWPHSFPYPDQYLNQYEEWLDARFSAPPLTIKFHGEFERVWKSLDYAVLALIFTTTFFA